MLRTTKTKSEPSSVTVGAPWTKQGSFSNTYDSGGAINRYVTYTHPSTSSKISIGGYQDGDKRISCGNKDLILSLLEKCKEKSLPIDDLDSEFVIIDLGSISLNISPSGKDNENAVIFIGIIEDVIGMDKETKKDIFEALGLKQIADPESFYNTLKGLISQGRVNDAIQQAIKTDDNDVLFDLGKYCEDIQQFDYAYRLYQQIPDSNLHYEDAAFQMAHLSALQSSQAPKEEFPDSLDIEEKKEASSSSLELQLSHLLSSNKIKQDPDRQRIIDLFYHQLSGSNDGQGTGLQVSEIKNIALDTRTLFNLAAQTRSLKTSLSSEMQRTQLLELEIEQLKKEKQELAAQLQSTTQKPVTQSPRASNSLFKMTQLIEGLEEGDSKKLGTHK